MDHDTFVTAYTSVKTNITSLRSERKRKRAVEKVSCVKCPFLTIVMIFMHQFDDRCHNSMYYYVIIVSKYVYQGSNVVFLGVMFYQTCSQIVDPAAAEERKRRKYIGKKFAKKRKIASFRRGEGRTSRSKRPKHSDIM